MPRPADDAGPAAKDAGPAPTQDTDTIAAVATAPGMGGVGVVRVSGPTARAIAEGIAGPGLKARQVSFRRFRDRSGDVLDSGIVLCFEAPASFTGEDVVELQGHGGPVVMQMLLDETLSLGARLARPGEFTERAFLNDKLDLAQAEAVLDLISSGSRAAVRGASRSLSGEFSARISDIDAAVVALRVYVEAAIDFADEELELLSDGRVTEQLTDIGARLGRLRDDCAQGVILRDGIRLALVGEPNVGKSSVLNRLVGEARAIVTDLPGTTRDLVRADLSIDGLPVEMVDTAGLRAAADQVEREGVRRALDAASEADVVLWIEAPDVTSGWSVEQLAASPERILRVWNKSDLDDEEAGPDDAVRVSALTGDGFDGLRKAILERVGFAPQESVFTARHRHLTAIDDALAAVGRASGLSRDAVAGELVAEELKLAHAALGEVVGTMSSDELLGEIFSRFCIGK